MTGERATEPEYLARFFVRRANAGDVDGLVLLYEPDAVPALPDRGVAVGREAIRKVYRGPLANRPTFEQGEQHPALRYDVLALTSTRLVGGGATAEMARRQPTAPGCGSSAGRT